MDKVLHEIRVLKTEKGIQIEVKGEGAKEWAKNLGSGIPNIGMSCCCCGPETEKKTETKKKKK